MNKANKMVKHGIYQEAWEDAITPLLQRTWDNNAGYYDWVGFIRSLLAEARKEERERVVTEFVEYVKDEKSPMINTLDLLAFADSLKKK
jgi:hypothetical protein